jgi:hypothetical protein
MALRPLPLLSGRSLRTVALDREQRPHPATPNTCPTRFAIRFLRKGNPRTSTGSADAANSNILRQPSPWSLTARFAERFKDVDGESDPVRSDRSIPGPTQTHALLKNRDTGWLPSSDQALLKAPFHAADFNAEGVRRALADASRKRSPEFQAGDKSLGTYSKPA